MSKFHKQSENMKALEQSLNDHMEICSLRRQVKRLKATVARLRASSFVTAVPVEQYERLRKAGDELAKCITPDDFNWARKYVILWREACKEGGQS